MEAGIGMLTEQEHTDAPLDDPKDQEARKAENKQKQKDALNAKAGGSSGGAPNGPDDDGQTTKETIERKKPGADGGKSRHVIERDKDGNVISKKHQVTKDGKTVHQHQDHIGKHGEIRRFSDEITGTKTINAD